MCVWYCHIPHMEDQEQLDDAVFYLCVGSRDPVQTIGLG